jgi:hypothetical protein
MDLSQNLDKMRLWIINNAVILFFQGHPHQRPPLLSGQISDALR